jgi:hypothetical protein
MYEYMSRRFQETGVPRFRENRHKIVVILSSLRSGRLYTQVLLLALISARGWVDPRTIAWPEGLSQWRIPVTKSGNRTRDFLLVAQFLNQRCHRLPKFVAVKVGKSYWTLNMKTTYMRLCVYYRRAQAYTSWCTGPHIIACKRLKKTLIWTWESQLVGIRLWLKEQEKRVSINEV